MTDLNNKLVVGISSRALFDLDESNDVFEKHGIDAYQEYQIANENKLLEPGPAFNLVQMFFNLNQYGSHIEIILLSRNSADTGLRVFNSIEHYGLDIKRAAFSSGQSPYRYVKAFGAHLFLSANPDDTRKALAEHCAAATIMPGKANKSVNSELRIAFDGDAVLFSDDAEKIYQEQGLDAFAASEKAAAQSPLADGPFRGFLSTLQTIQRNFDANNCLIRTALVTARSAPAHERVIRTLRHWDIRIDEALFLGGLSKREFLQAFGADIFFDDQRGHCDSAVDGQVATGHVPHGVLNKE